MRTAISGKPVSRYQLCLRANYNNHKKFKLMKMSFSHLTTKDLAALCQRVIAISDEPAFAVVANHPLLDMLKAEYSDYDNIYTKKTSSGKGKLLAETDDLRDTTFTALKSILYGHSRAKASPVQQDAADIYTLIGKYGTDLIKYKYAEETASLKKLIEELEKPENKAKMQNMQLLPVFDELKANQVNFEKIFNDAAGENSELRLMSSASSTRHEVEATLHTYLTMVKTMTSQPGWRELYSKLDEAVKAAFNSHTTAKAEAAV